MVSEPTSGTPAALPPKPAQAQTPAGRHRLWRKLLTVLVIGYGASIVALWAWMVWQGDRNWLATLFLFGPRWICGLPLPCLALGAAVWQRRLLGPLAVTAVVIVFPMMGLQVHLPAPAAAAPGLRVMTCNVNQDQFRVFDLAELIEQEKPDLVALQEVTIATRFIWPPGWHAVKRDHFILASRFAITGREDVSRLGRPGVLAAMRFELQLPDREIQVFNVHLQTPRQGFEAVLSRQTLIATRGIARLQAVLREREAEARKTSDWIAQFPGPKIVMGDFNTPVESTLFRRDWSWLADAFSKVGLGFGFTKITEVAGWSYGARIDHVLYSREWRVLRCWVAGDIGSDHLPLLAEFE
jgi:vancomycin resistance protein VanJ